MYMHVCSPNALIVIFCVIIADHIVKLVSSVVGQVPVEDVKPTVCIFHPSSQHSLAPPPHGETNVCESIEVAEPKSHYCSAAGELFGCNVEVCQQGPFFAANISCTHRDDVTSGVLIHL